MKMGKKSTKRGEKLGEIVGRRRPVAGSVLIFIGALMLISVVSYTGGQPIFFKELFEPFMPTTETSGQNLCGPFGATFALVSILAFGAATWMVPFYVIWTGIMLWQRRAKAVTLGALSALVGGVLLFSILAAIMQATVSTSGLANAYFPSGWGGGFGTFVFDKALFPLLDIFGSALLVGVLLLFCLVVVFVDSPMEAARELAGVAKKSPSVFIRVSKILWKALIFFPVLIYKAFKNRKDGDESAEGEADAESVREILLRPQSVKISVKADEEEAEEEPDEIPAEAPNTEDLDDEIFFATAAESAQRGGVTPIVDFSSRFDDDDEIPADVSKEIDLSNAKIEKQEAAAGETMPAAAPKKKAADDDGFVVETLEQKAYKPPKQPEKKRGNFVFPSIDLLNPAKPVQQGDEENYKQRIVEIVQKIGDFGIKVEPYKASPGPVITRYEVRPAPGVRVSKIASLEDDIALGIRAEKVRVIAPIPGAGTVGIEVPNRKRQMVCMRDIIESEQWNTSKAEIPIALGKDVTGMPIVLDLTKMPHALIAGSTGSGKSVCVNSIIASLVYKMTPDDLRFIMVDPKVVEMQVYNSLPHMLVPVVTDPRKVPAALKWLTGEMMRRYAIFSAAKVRNIAGFNAKILKDKEEAEKAAAMDASMTAEERAAALEAGTEVEEDDIEIPEKKLPYIVCIIDELNDLMMVAGKEVEGAIARLTQLARAAGIHLLVATQRPSTDVITGLIKSNLPTRIAFKVASQIDSRTILDKKGAETLIGCGDMLFISAGSSEPVRAQGAFMSDEEITKIVEALKVNGEPEFAEDVQSQIESAGEDEDGDDAGEGGEFDDVMTPKAIAVIRATKKASTSLLQRKLGIGYGRAARIIDELESRGVIGPDNGPGSPREIFLD